MSKKDFIRIGVLVLGALIMLLLISIFCPLSKGVQEVEQIRINDYIIDVYIADEPDEYTRGFSNIGLDELEADGMLFVFEDQDIRTFWMNEMEFDLDVLWIHNGLIVKIEQGIPVSNQVRYMNSEPFEVDQVLELPAGLVEKMGIKVEDWVVR